MALVTHTIKALTQGVSQQTPSVRLDSQVEEQINMVPDLAFGLTKRNPIKLNSAKVWSGAYDASEEDAMFTYTDTDGTKVSLGVRKNGTVYRFDNNGIKVINQLDMTYLVHTDSRDIEFLETNENIFILNKGVIVSEVSTPPANYVDKGLVWIRGVTTANKYSINIRKNGASIYAATHTALAGETANDVLLSFTAAVGALPDVLIATLFSNSLFIQFVAEPLVPVNTYTVELTDTYGLEEPFAIMSASEHQEGFLVDADILPQLNASGSGHFFTVRISATQTVEGVYYLDWDLKDKLWSEGKLDDYLIFDELTLPKQITKGAVDIPVISFAAADMLVGDSVSNEKPSFLNNKITDMFLFQGRLIFSSTNKLSFSEVDNYFNFYRTSTATLLSSDRIDIELQADRLGYKPIENIFGTDGKLFVNTGETQSLLSTTTDLNLTKSKFAQVGAHDLGQGIPTSIRDTVYFPVTKDTTTNIRDFRLNPNTGVGYTGELVTKHCDKYIKGTVKQVIYSEEHLILRTDDDDKTLYVQKSYSANGTLRQNAWFKWTVSGPYSIKHLYKEGSTLHIVVDDVANTQTLYGELDLILSQVIEDVPAQIGYFPYLDWWTDNDPDRGIATGTISVSKVTGAVTVAPSGTDDITGVPFEETSVTLSEQVPRTSDGETDVKLGFAKMMLRRFQGTLGFTGRLEIQTTKTGRGTTVQKHMPKPIGVLLVGREAVSDTDLKFSVNGRAQDVEIKIVDKGIFTPMNIISLEYQAQLITRGSRI